jgi:hypothetical protein
MPVSTLRVDGSVEVKSASAGVSSGAALLTAALSTQMTFDEYSYQVIDLDSDSITAVPFGAITNVNALMIQVVGPAGVTVRITTATNSVQAVPVGKLLLLASADTNILALDVQRAAGQATTLYVLLGQRA